MPILHSPGVMTPGQLGPIRRDLRAGERALHLHHVEHRDALGDADDQRDLRIDRLEDRVGGERRRHVDHRRVGAGLGDRLGHGVEHRQVEMRGAAFARRHAAHHLGAVGDRLLGMEGALRAGEALADDLGVLVDQDGHQAGLLHRLDDLLGGVGEVFGRRDLAGRTPSGSSCRARRWCLRAAPPAARAG